MSTDTWKTVTGRTSVAMCAIALAGCWTERTAPDPAPPLAEHVHPEHGTHSAAEESQLVISTGPSQIAAGELVQLQMMIHEADGTMVREFDTFHEKKVHLIIVRGDLGTFDHVHPDIDADGNLSTEFAFPTGGRYLFYADHKPTGQDQMTARGELQVAGDSPPATAIEPNVPGDVSGEHLSANVSVDHSGHATEITFDLLDSAGLPVDDLEPYLGAMGHLVIVSADGEEYVHAHPHGGEEVEGNRVQFSAHFAQPGLYKGWGQFQRAGTVQTVPFVLEVN